MKEMSESDQRVVACGLLKELRSAKGLTQTEVAHQLGKPQSYVSKYEAGERQLDVIELISVCRALGTTLVHFSRALTERVP